MPPNKKMSGKRKRDEWERVNRQEVCDKVLAPGADVLFVRSSSAYYREGYDSDPSLVGSMETEKFRHDPLKVHPDGTPMSVCAQYVLWLDPSTDVETIRSKYTLIELWTYGDTLFLFRQDPKPGFFTKQKSNFDALAVHREYLPESCLGFNGFTKSTSMMVLAFYYLKILPPELRARVYLNPSYIIAPPFGAVRNRAFKAKEKLFEEGFRDFITFTNAKNCMGVSHVSEDDAHAQTLVYDAPNKRLEIYDSDTTGPLNTLDMQDTLYGHFAGRGPLLQEEFGICKLYGNGLHVQGRMQEDMYGKGPEGFNTKSCALWSTMNAICRMTGVDRDRLPIMFQDVMDTSTLIRTVLFRTCGLDQLKDKLIGSQAEFDRLIQNCRPDPADVEAILGSITKHQSKTPILIPPDRELCEEEKKDAPPCTAIYLNLNEIKLTREVVTYFRTLCPQATRIDLQIPDDNSIDYEQIRYLYLFDQKPVTLNLITPAGATLDLDDVVVSFVVHTMLTYSKNITVHTQQATVTSGFVNERIRNSPIWKKFHVDRILLTKPTSAETYQKAVAALKDIADNVFGVIQQHGDLAWAKTSGLNHFVFGLQQFVLPDTFEGFPIPTTFITKW